jgi:S-adenosyl-L-methionine hydrolase (adenosine-forming)
MREPVSQTFHGRDVFAPVAAHLAAGAVVGSLGDRIGSITALDIPPVQTGTSAVTGTVIHIDRFGNAVTNLALSDLPSDPLIMAGGVTIDRLSSHYQQAPVVALVGSAGLVEVAIRNGSAAERLNLAVGSQIEVRQRP